VNEEKRRKANVKLDERMKNDTFQRFKAEFDRAWQRMEREGGGQES